MRHQISGRKFSRTSAHRKAMFANMCTSLVEHELIKTTLAKAKDLRRYFEPLVTVAKSDSVAARRYVFDRLRSKAAVGKLFTDLGPRFKERPGGYISIIKCGYRQGDNAPMAIVRLMDRSDEVEVDVEEDVVVEEPKKAKKSKEAKDSSDKSESKATKASKSTKEPKASEE